jgi:hypothetical protein
MMAISTPSKIEGTATEIIHYLEANGNGGKYALVPLISSEATLSEKNIKAIQVLRKWAQEDETDDEDVLKARENATKILHQQLNENRRQEGAEELFP